MDVFPLRRHLSTPAAVGCGALVLAALILFLGAKRPGSFPLSPDIPPSVTEVEAALDAVYEAILGREVVWQIPAGVPGRDIRGVAFYAHGCNHKAVDFWPKSESCAHCTGLPEDIVLTRAALSRGFAVIAVSSLDTCWDVAVPPESTEDVVDVGKVLTFWRANHSLDGALPLVALGASSGGYFIPCLAHQIKLDALVIIISSGVEQAFRERPGFGAPYPPTLFVHMPKDAPTAFRVARSMKILEAAGVATAEIRCYEMKIDGRFFSSRIDGVDEKASTEMFQAILEAGLVNATGFLRHTYSGKWAEVLGGKGLLSDETLIPKVNEELRLAFGWHEMTSQYSREIVDWFQGICVMRDGVNSAGNLLNSGRCKSYF